MASLPIVLTALAVLSLAAHLAAEASMARGWVYLLKPLTTWLVIGVGWTLARDVTHPAGRRYAGRVLVGLGCSLAGDVALMLPGDHLVAGLVAFLGAHLCYIAAFVCRGGRLRVSLTALPFAVGYVLLVATLAPHVGPLLGPVAVYGAILLAMAWSAAETWRRTQTIASAAAALGALLFVASDTVLAFGRFVPGVPRSETAVMVTYIAAQLFIVWSIANLPRPRGAEGAPHGGSGPARRP